MDMWQVATVVVIASIFFASSFPYAVPFQNDTSTGTTCNTLTGLNSSGQAIILGAGATKGFIGIAVSGCGKGGTVWIVTMGNAPLLMENTGTAQHYVEIGSYIYIGKIKIIFKMKGCRECLNCFGHFFWLFLKQRRWHLDNKG
jgi:hypothetical protein